MKTIGFPISRKENEKRRAIVPEYIKQMQYPGQLYFEFGYGEVLGVSDQEYLDLGCHMCSLYDCLKCDVICDPKVGDADYLDELRPGQTIFGWVHATQNREITDVLIQNGLTVYAWEKMYDRERHVFWQNNELAGEAAVIHAFQCFGWLPYKKNVAVIGRGNTARGAVRMLNMLGANVVQYDRRTEQLLRDELGEYDVVINCILWDVMRKDHVIYRRDLARMKKGAMIIDVSCDRSGGIETCIPTTIEDPVYTVDGIMHYAVDHTPALFHKTFTYNNSQVVSTYLDQLVVDAPGKVLKGSLIIVNGLIVDQEIISYQKR